MRRWLLPAAIAAFWIGASIASGCRAAQKTPLLGYNVIAAPGHPFGSPSARLALAEAAASGASAIAVVPFLWQASPASPALVRGNDMTDTELQAAIRDAHALGLAVLVKPQVWVPGGWAGVVAMNSAADWTTWFANYRRELERIATVAETSGADALAIGTELAGTSRRPEWTALIAAVRKRYGGRLLYVAHNLDEADRIPFWGDLDCVGVTLYPPLGADNDRAARRATMRLVAAGLDRLAARTGKSIFVAEIGLRSARGAAAKPWESVEERASAPDAALQADVLADWLAVLDRPSVRGVLIWRWLTDPNAGGMDDTDFTVQGKPAQRVLACARAKQCNQDTADVEPR